MSLRQWLGLKFFNKYHQTEIERHTLSTLFWELTLRCNLHCRHCGSDCKTVAGIQDMPMEDFLRVIDTITPHINPNKTLIIFSGGEALVRRDLELCGKELYDRGYPWGVVTNGLLLTRQRLDSMVSAGLRSMTISIDGLEEYHNWVRGNDRSWQCAIEGARMAAVEERINFDVVSCISGRNIDSLSDLKELLISNGIKAWRIFTIFPVGRAAQDESLKVTDAQFVKILDFIEDTRREGRIKVDYACEGFLGGYETKVRDNFYACQAGISTASIRVDGAISGCTSIRAGFDQGNIYRDDFMDVWNNRFGSFRNREWSRKGICGGCKVFDMCRGGGMHLYDDDRRLLLCHYNRLR